MSTMPMRRRVLPRWRQLGDIAHLQEQMLIFRLVFGLLLLTGLLCFAMYIGSGQAVWRQRGLVIVKWTVLAALGFFAVLVLERLAVML